MRLLYIGAERREEVVGRNRPVNLMEGKVFSFRHRPRPQHRLLASRTRLLPVGSWKLFFLFSVYPFDHVQAHVALRKDIHTSAIERVKLGFRYWLDWLTVKSVFLGRSGMTKLTEINNLLIRVYVLIDGSLLKLCFKKIVFWTNFESILVWISTQTFLEQSTFFLTKLFCLRDTQFVTWLQSEKIWSFSNAQFSKQWKNKIKVLFWNWNNNYRIVM